MVCTHTRIRRGRERVKLRESKSTFQRPHTHNFVVIVRENWVTLSMFIHCGKQRKGLMLCKQIIYSISSEMVRCDGNGWDSGSYSIIKASLSLPSMLPSSLLRNGRQNICFFFLSVSMGRLSSFIYSLNKFTHPTIWQSVTSTEDHSLRRDENPNPCGYTFLYIIWRKRARTIISL